MSTTTAGRLRTHAISVWDGQRRPTPADLRGPAYDIAPSPARHTLLVCAAPRSSSKRLARLLLGAGLGIPMEYLNETTVTALTARWQISRREYLAHVRARRTANGIFASNLQHRQIEAWPHRRDIDALFENARVVHLIRLDKTAQAASLAACMLTGHWGFEEPPAVVEFSPRDMKRVARQAMAAVAAEDAHLRRWFDRYGVEAIPVTSDEVNRTDLRVVADLAARLDIEFDRTGAERMLECDSGRYRGYDGLKQKLREYLPS